MKQQQQNTAQNKNWKENNYPFKKFTEELTQEWINAGFNKKETRDWLESDLQSSDAEFAQWLRDFKIMDIEWFADYGSEENLRKEFQNRHLEKSSNTQMGWQFIHPDFTPGLQKKWKKREFNSEECKKWINSGLLPTDADYSQWLRDTKKIDAGQLIMFNYRDKGREKLREEYLQSKISLKQSEIALLLKKMMNELLQNNTELNSQGWVNKNNKKDNAFFKQIKNKKNNPLSIGETLKLLEIIEKNKDICLWKLTVLELINELKKDWERKEFYEEGDACANVGLKLNDSDHLDHPQWLRETKGLSFESFETYRIDEKLKKQYQESKQCQMLIKLLSMIESGILPISNESDNKLSAEVIDKVKVFLPYYLMNIKIRVVIEQMKLIERLMPNPKLRERYKSHGLCQECRQPNTYTDWCQLCKAQHFQKQFEYWTSGSKEVDQTIQKHQLRATSWKGSLVWIPHHQLTDIEYLAEGGFGKVYRAKWKNGKEVALKSLYNSQNTTADFLREIIYNKFFEKYDDNIVQCYGISQDPSTGNYIMVMDYMKYGDLRQFLQNNYDKLEIWDKVERIDSVVGGLRDVHEKGLVHRDFHLGNILVDESGYTHIADLGLSRPANEENSEKVYGVLPYVAPEVLRNKDYTQASDIYSFGIIAYEILVGLPPYHKCIYDEFLAVKVCQGLRPNLDEIVAPQLLKDLINKCWDADPLQRPTTNEIKSLFADWIDGGGYVMLKNTELTRQVQEIEGEVPPLFLKLDNKNYQKMHPRAFSHKSYTKTSESKKTTYKIHSQAIYTSRLLNFKNLPEPQNSKAINKIFYKLSEELEELRITDPVKFSTELEKRFKSLEIQEKSLEILMAESEEIPPIKISEQLNINWTEINSSFTEELIHSWTSHNFTSHQTQDWLNIGLKPTDYNFCSWFRDTKHLTPEQVLNDHSLEQLSEEFFNWQQAQIEVVPK